MHNSSKKDYNYCVIIVTYQGLLPPKISTHKWYL